MQKVFPGVVLVVAAAAVAVLAAGWYFEARQRQQDAVAFEARLSRLEHLQPPPEERAWPREPASGYAPAGSLAGLGPSGHGVAMSPRTIEDAGRQAAVAKAELEAKFANDGSDAPWAMATEGEVNRAIADPGLVAFKAPQASDIRCARTMCRLVFTFASLDQAQDWLTFYPLGVASQLPVFRSQTLLLPDGSVQLSMFGFRDAKVPL